MNGNQLEGVPTLMAIETILSPVQPIFRARLPLLPPGINASYHIIKMDGDGEGKRRFALTSEARQFKQDAALLLSQHEIYDYSLVNAIRAAASRRGGVKPQLQLFIKFFLPSLWKRDIDGGVKIVMDSVFNYLELNDNLVTSLVVSKSVSRDDPHTLVELRCYVPPVVSR